MRPARFRHGAVDAECRIGLHLAACGQSASMASPTLGFIVGCPRTGTTWLQLLLLQDPRVVSVQETHVFTEWIDPLVTATRAERARSRNVGLGALYDDDEVLDLARGLFEPIVARALVERPDATVFVEKTPGHLHRVATIVDLYPRARIVEIVRDPRAVVASLLAAERTWGSSWAPSDAAAASRQWRNSVRAGNGLADFSERVLRVRYEDLAADGPATLMRVMALLDLPADAGHCQRLFEMCAVDRLGDGEVTKPLGMSGNVAETARNGHVEGWRDELDRAQVRTIETICADEMVSLGYEPDDGGGVLPPLPLITGSAKAAGRRAFDAVASASAAAAQRIG